MRNSQRKAAATSQQRSFKKQDANQPIERVLQSIHASLEESKKTGDRTKQIQMEFVYIRQRANLLQQEREILRWHNDNNYKALALKRSECEILLQKIAEVKESLQIVKREKARASRWRDAFSREAAKIERKNEQLEKERRTVIDDVEGWRARRDGFEVEITRERREADEERRKRDAQYRLLQLARNREKRVQERVHLLQSTMGVSLSNTEN